MQNNDKQKQNATSKKLELQVEVTVDMVVKEVESKSISKKERLYRLAIEKWMEKNPSTPCINIPKYTEVEVEGKQIKIGNHINNLRNIYSAMQKGKHFGNYKDLTEEEIAYWGKYGIFEKKTKNNKSIIISHKENIKTEYDLLKQAIEKWKKQNPDKDYRDISTTETVIVDGTIVQLGQKLIHLKRTYTRELSNEEIDFWKELGIFEQKKIIDSNLEPRINNSSIKKEKVKSDNEQLYRRAIEIWKQENSELDYVDIPLSAKVTIDDKEIAIGHRVARMRSIYNAMQKGEHYGNNKDLTEEQVDYWNNLGIFNKKERKNFSYENRYNHQKKEQLNRRAIEKWKEEHPELDYIDIPQSAKVIIDGQEVAIGRIILRIRNVYSAMQKGKHFNNYKDLTEEEITYWSSLGIFESKSKVKSNRKQVNKSLDKRTEKSLLYRRAIEKWKAENPELDYIDIPFDTKVIIDDKEISIGHKVSRIRSIYNTMQRGEHFGNYKDLTEEEIAFWGSLGIFKSKRKVKNGKTKENKAEDKNLVKELTYRRAIKKWKEENSDIDYIDIPTNAKVIIDGKMISIGSKVSRIKKIYSAMQKEEHYYNYNDLTEEQIEYWGSLGIFETKKRDVKITPKSYEEKREVKEQIYRKAIEKWKEENSDIDYINIPRSAKVIIDDKEILIGNRVSKIKSIYNAMQKGNHFGNYKDLTEEEITYWKSLGILGQRKPVSKTKKLEAEIRKNEKQQLYEKALEIWKEENPDKNYNDIQRTTKIIVDGQEVSIGSKIVRVKAIYSAMQKGKHHGNYKDLTEEEIAFWGDFGVFERKRKPRSTNIQNHPSKEKKEDKDLMYRRAIEKWKEENKDIDYIDIPKSAVVTIDGVEILIGQRVIKLRAIYSAMQKGKHFGNYKDLTEEEIAYWKNLGIFEKKKRAKKVSSKNRNSKQKLYEKALEIWKQENPNKKYNEIIDSTKVMVGGKEICIGSKITRIKSIYNAMQKGKHYGNYKDLTEEEITYWKNLGIFEKRKSKSETNKIASKERKKEKEQLLKKALEKWKKKNPDIDYIDMPVDTYVTINNKKIYIGRKIQVVRSIYSAMQKGKKYGNYKDLSIEELAYWKSLGVLEPKRRKKITEPEKSRLELYKKALKKWKIKNKDLKYSDITENEIIEVDEQQVKIGAYLKAAKEAYTLRKNGITKIALSDQELDYLESLGIFKSIKKEKLQKPLKQQTRYKKIKDTISILKEYNQDSKVFYIDDIKRILKIDLEVFQQALETLEPNHVIKKEQKIDPYKTIRKYCLENGYNIENVKYLIKMQKIFKDEPIEKTLEIVLKVKQNPTMIDSWIYEKYGIHIFDILNSINVRQSRVISDMSKNIIPIEEALKKEVFSKNCIGKENYSWLERLYNGMLHQLTDYNINKSTTNNALEIYDWEVDSCELTSDESKFLLNCFKDYVKTISEFRILEVGLESNKSNKIKKILSYHLTHDDIEESYTQALMFEKGHLIDENSKLYERRQLVRQYIIDWDYYTKGEKDVLENSGYFSRQEIELIKTTRNEIDEMILEIQRRRIKDKVKQKIR
ncbi:MAG: hypothetical protein E7168_03645 [Firmicutes bacterium]|nr:hypothetical protein [Bacillota bacterium]